MADYSTIDIDVRTKHRTKRERKYTFSEESQCSGKIRYSYQQAERNARRLTREKNIEFRSYYCVYCKHYHAGRK